MIYLSKNPLCELCLDEETVNEDGSVRSIVTSAQEVHHKRHILSGNDRQEMIALATNPNNLQSLCHWHHEFQHRRVADPRFII